MKYDLDMREAGFFALRKPKTLTSALTTLLLFTSLSTAGEFKELSIIEEADEYRLRIVMIMDSSADYVYRVITDYKHLYRIHPSITESEILPSPDNESVRLRNRFEYCIALSCFDIDWVEDIKELQDGYLKAETVPELSDVESGTAIWRVQPHGEHARVSYQSQMKPDFFIPPLIGNMIMKYKLREEAITTFTRIECHATILSTKEAIMNDPVQLAAFLKGGGSCAG
jgi:hypothetical protein